MEARDPLTLPGQHSLLEWPSHHQFVLWPGPPSPSNCPPTVYGPNRSLFLLMRIHRLKTARETSSDKLSKPHPVQSPLPSHPPLFPDLQPPLYLDELIPAQEVVFVTQFIFKCSQLFPKGEKKGKTCFRIMERWKGKCKFLLKI